MQFLDILACNPTPGGKIDGQVLVNGVPRRAAPFRRATCYVMQRDVLMASATVRESIATSAYLKLPMSMSNKEKDALVSKVLEELGLLDCQNTLIGDELLGMKGVSGGQRRRVSIGIELVKEPRAIFLDEPTSGLDSEMAVAIMETLQNLARKNRTICLTIHQPNSLITSKFDDFMLLAYGELVYFGAWEDSIAFFATAGLHCPQFTNPTDFFLHALQDEANAAVLVEQQHRATGGSSAVVVAAAAIISSENRNDDEETGGGGNTTPIISTPLHTTTTTTTSSTTTKTQSEGHPEVPAYYQTWILTIRNLRNYLRNPVLLFSETAQYAFMGLFVGLMYLQLNNSVETGVSDRLASLWFGMAVLSFTPSFSAVTVWDRERVLLRREAGQSLYSLGSWFAARTAVTVPMQIAQTLLFGLVAFFMVGYSITASNLMIYLAAYALFQITSESIGVLCAAVTTNSTSAILALTFVLLLLLSFSGFLVSDIPVYFEWVKYISYLTYALSGVVLSEFSQTDFVCTQGPPACAEQGQIIPGSQLVPATIDNGLSPGMNLLVLLGICVGTRIMCFVVIIGAFRLHFL